MTNILKTEGLVLHAAPYQEYDRILTVFTPQDGLLKFFHKRGASVKKGGCGTTVPLTEVELVYTLGRGDLHQCREISVLNYNLALRQNLETLEAACDILQSILSTQQSGKESSPLYRLLLAYLKKLPSSLDPATLKASFRLKLLCNEGLFGNLYKCSTCLLALNEDSYFSCGDNFCKHHSPSFALQISANERDILHLLAFSRDLNLLASLPMTKEVLDKAIGIFEHSTQTT